MNYKIVATCNFVRELERLARKFPSLKNDLEKFESELLLNPRQGDSLGGNAYKVRLAVKSKGKGKSGGMRVITYLELDFIITDLTNIFLLSIYDKSEAATISKEEIRRLITAK